ncbi:unnamed protein product [Lota lota]
MKPQEGELVTEISKLQCMVSELKSGFSSALLELSQIQHGDSYLREEMEENRRSCQKKARRLETMVETLREELGLLQCQILQLDINNRVRAQQEDRAPTTTQKESEPGETARGRTQCEGCSGQQPPSSSSPRGRLLLHSYLQGLKAGLCGETDARHQVVMQLLHSEWEYVSTLNHIYDKYKNSPQITREPYQSYLQFVDQMLQRHLVFRNTLQERLSAEHWKSLVGDLLVQLIGHNNTTFMDVYIGYTTALASFLSLEFHRAPLGDKTQKKTKDQAEREEGKLLSLLLAPVSRIHGYLGHIQNLLQWTGKDHPDCSLLLGSEKVLRETLSRCHTILEQDVQWEEDPHPTNQSGKCSGGPPACVSSANCCARSQLSQGPAGHPARDPSSSANQRDEQPPQQATGVAMRCPSMHLECWSCSPVSRKRDRLAQGGPSTRDCGINSCFATPPPPPPLLSPRAPGFLRPPDTPPTIWETSDSGQGTSSQPTGQGPDDAEDGETDQDDTSAFDYSSVTSCSPDGTLRTGPGDSNTGGDDEDEEDEEEEEDSQVPVLLRPGCQQQRRRREEACRERTVCLRWQIPRLTPHPPSGEAAGSGVGACTEGPCLVGSYGKRLVSIRKGSPPLHPKSAFRPIWDDPSKQADPAPERDLRQGFVPVPGQGRHTFQKFSQKRENMRQAGALQQLGSGHVGATPGHGGLWDDSEDSEGPCSTV